MTEIELENIINILTTSQLENLQPKRFYSGVWAGIKLKNLNRIGLR